MKLTNLETYFYILDHMEAAVLDTLCEEHPKERISISVLKYLRERKKLIDCWEKKRDVAQVANTEGTSRSKVYRAIKSKKKIGTKR